MANETTAEKSRRIYIAAMREAEELRKACEARKAEREAERAKG